MLCAAPDDTGQTTGYELRNLGIQPSQVCITNEQRTGLDNLPGLFVCC